MSFTASLSTRGDTAVITMTGDLDDASAEVFRARVSAAAGQDLNRLVLDMSRLERLSAAGLRGLAFCREKMSNDVEIVFVSPSEDVRQAIDQGGLQRSATIADSIPE